MSLFKFIKAIIFCTVLALIYIHMQMQIYALAYEGKKREQEIVSLSERNGVLAYEILSLKSAHNLGERVLGNNQSRLKFCDNQNVVQIVTTKPEMQKVAMSTTKTSKANFLLNLFAKTGTAAHAEEETSVIKPWRPSR